MYMTKQPYLGPRLRGSEQMLRRVQLLNARHGHPQVAITVNADSPLVVEKKTICGIIFEFIILFLSESSIHGLNHLVAKKRNLIEIVVWALFIVLAIFGAVWVSLDIWRHYNESPVTISMERNYMDWSTTIPSGTLCPLVPVDEIKLKAFVDGLENVEDKERLKDFLRKLAKANYNNFKDMTDIPNNPIKSNDYLKTIIQIRTELKFLVSNSEYTWDPEMVLSVTEVGICYTYHTHVAIYNTPNYWAQRNMSIVQYPENRKLEGNPVAGSMSGTFANIQGEGLTFYYHSPYDVVDVSSQKFVLKPLEFKTLTIGALTTYTTEEAQKLSFQQRKCRFTEENNLKISPVYTFNFCRMECRLQIAKKMCNCVPHFYRRPRGAKICDVQGMRCLGNHSELLTKLIIPGIQKRYPCNCLPECNLTSYFLQMEVTNPAINIWIGGSLGYGIEEYPRMRLKRDVIFGFSDLWVSIGGTGGLFLGCSVLSIIEIFYYFTMRFIIFVLEIYRKRRSQDPRERQQHPLGSFSFL